MKTCRVIVTDPVGLHARPAAMFVEMANKFKAEVMLCNLTGTKQWANAKSILGVLTCGVRQNDEIEIKAEGADEAQAVTSLEQLVQSNFVSAAS